MYKIYHDNLGFIKTQALTIINGSLLNFKLIFKPTLFYIFIDYITYGIFVSCVLKPY